MRAAPWMRAGGQGMGPWACEPASTGVEPPCDKHPSTHTFLVSEAPGCKS